MGRTHPFIPTQRLAVSRRAVQALLFCPASRTVLVRTQVPFHGLPLQRLAAKQIGESKYRDLVHVKDDESVEHPVVSLTKPYLYFLRYRLTAEGAAYIEALERVELPSGKRFSIVDLAHEKEGNITELLYVAPDERSLGVICIDACGAYFLGELDLESNEVRCIQELFDVFY